MPSENGHGFKPERVGLYMRVSSEEQKTKETIETQVGFLEQYCKLYRHEIVKVYKDEAVSGTVPMDERLAGRELLEDAKAGKFDVILAYKLDRIGRTLLVVVDAHDRLQATGIALRSATEPIDTSTPAGRLIFQMLASFAEFEKETINERTRDGKNRAYRNGVQPGVIPYGYDIADDGSFVVVEEEAAVVRDIIHNIAGGATLFAEAKRLNLQGMLSPGKKYRSRPRQHGTTWTPMAISRIVRRSAYSGTHVIHSSTGEIEREVPFIVSGELQESAIARRGTTNATREAAPCADTSFEVLSDAPNVAGATAVSLANARIATTSNTLAPPRRRDDSTRTYDAADAPRSTRCGWRISYGRTSEVS